MFHLMLFCVDLSPDLVRKNRHFTRGNINELLCTKDLPRHSLLFDVIKVDCGVPGRLNFVLIAVCVHVRHIFF